MNSFNIGVGLIDGSVIDIELDVDSLGDLHQYDEEEMDEELRYLIKQQYPEFIGKAFDIHC